jgi:hypothetical protein
VGADTCDVLREAGYDAAGIDALLAAGVAVTADERTPA